MILRGLIGSVLLVLVMPAAALAQAPSPAAGTITGEVVNATADGSSTANVSVTLFSLADNTSVARGTAVTDVSGRFAFQNVSANLGAYAVAATFQNAHYFSDTQTYSQNGTGARVVLRVYDSTTDDAAIKIVSSHTVVVVQGESLLIQEVYVFANMSDRTYVGVSSGSAGQRTTLRFPLPAGASGLEVGGDIGPTGIVPAQDGFADTTPVQPGQLQGYYTYTVPLVRGPYTYTRSVNYPTISYKILVQGKNVSISGDRLVSSGTTSAGTTGGAGFSGATATDLPRGFVVSARISGLPGTSGVPAVMLLVIASVAVVVVGLGIFMFVRRRKPSADLSPVRDEESLLAELADLDDLFENGRMVEAEYQKKREALKAELVDLIDNSNRMKRG